MEESFGYSKYVSGRNFIGRSSEAKALANLLNQGENVVLYEPPKTGITSVIQNGLLLMKPVSPTFEVIKVSFLDVRSERELLLRLGWKLISSCAGSLEGQKKAAEELLQGTHFVFSEELLETDGRGLNAKESELCEEDARAIFSLPVRVAERRGVRILVLLEEFQNILQCEEGEKLCRILEGVLNERKMEEKLRSAYIFTGSMFNAMHDIFGVKKRFYKLVERVELHEIDPNEIVEHIIRGFSLGGKVVDRELLFGVCKLFRNNIFYINLFSSFCDSLSKGYITRPTLDNALENVISIFRPMFRARMNDLTTFQVSLLEAILCGHTRLTSSEVIETFSLNSSANVKRLKEALSKKEIVSFANGDSPLVIDPLFEYWLKTEYFKTGLRFHNEY